MIDDPLGLTDRPLECLRFEHRDSDGNTDAVLDVSVNESAAS
jgi:hypothetical protein